MGMLHGTWQVELARLGRKLHTLSVDTLINIRRDCGAWDIVIGARKEHARTCIDAEEQ